MQDITIYGFAAEIVTGRGSPLLLSHSQQENERGPVIRASLTFRTFGVQGVIGWPKKSLIVIGPAFTAFNPVSMFLRSPTITIASDEGLMYCLATLCTSA